MRLTNSQHLESYSFITSTCWLYGDNVNLTWESALLIDVLNSVNHVQLVLGQILVEFILVLRLYDA